MNPIDYPETPDRRKVPPTAIAVARMTFRMVAGPPVLLPARHHVLSDAVTRLLYVPFPQGEKVFLYAPGPCAAGPEEFSEYSPKFPQMMYLP